jgi:hypothetical protein
MCMCTQNERAGIVKTKWGVLTDFIFGFEAEPGNWTPIESIETKLQK